MSSAGSGPTGGPAQLFFAGFVGSAIKAGNKGGGREGIGGGGVFLEALRADVDIFPPFSRRCHMKNKWTFGRPNRQSVERDGFLP